MLEAAIKKELAHLYSLWSTSPLSTWLLVHILWHYIYKCTGVALQGILGRLQPEGHGCANSEQSGLQHSTWSSAGNQTHSFLSTEIKSTSTDIISGKISVKFLQNCITDKWALILALAKACHWRRATHQCAEVKVCNAYMCKEPQTPWCPFLCSEVPESFPLGCDTHTDMHTQAVQKKHWSIISLKSRKRFLVTSARSACRRVSWEPAKESCRVGTALL